MAKMADLGGLISRFVSRAGDSGIEEEIVWHVDCCFIGLVALLARIYCLEAFVFIVSTRLASFRYVHEKLR